MFGFLKKKTRAWDKLDGRTREAASAKLSRIVRAMAGARYKIVSGSDQWQREQGVTETRNEDQILDFSKRGRLLDMTRNAIRNNATFNTILKQFDL